MEPYIGEIRCFSFGRIPNGWLPCSGQSLEIRQYQALFALLKNFYGGDGKVNFLLPNLNGAVPMHYNLTAQSPNQGFNIGAKSGAETVQLDTKMMPPHTHLIRASTATANKTMPAGAYLAAPASPHLAYTDARQTLVNMAEDFVSIEGGSGIHPNMQPYLTVNFCIAISGIWPQRP